MTGRGDFPAEKSHTQNSKFPVLANGIPVFIYLWILVSTQKI